MRLESINIPLTSIDSLKKKVSGKRLETAEVKNRDLLQLEYKDKIKAAITETLTKYLIVGRDFPYFFQVSDTMLKSYIPLRSRKESQVKLRISLAAKDNALVINLPVLGWTSEFGDQVISEPVES